MAYLELQSLHRSFGPVVALQGIDVSMNQGEFLSLLGPSGCGKTTALRLVAGFDRPDSGSIVIDGKDITRLSPSRRDMGMVFQAYSLFPNMTAEKNVEYGLRIRKQGRGERRKKVEELLELVGLGHAGKRYPHQLSGGMQQRVALARALAIVMGEFTIATLSAFHTFPTYIQYINETQAYPAAAVSLMSFGITWAAMLSILLVGRRPGARQVQIAGTR